MFDYFICLHQIFSLFLLWSLLGLFLFDLQVGQSQIALISRVSDQAIVVVEMG